MYPKDLYQIWAIDRKTMEYIPRFYVAAHTCQKALDLAERFSPVIEVKSALHPAVWVNPEEVRQS